MDNVGESSQPRDQCVFRLPENRRWATITLPTAIGQDVGGVPRVHCPKDQGKGLRYSKRACRFSGAEAKTAKVALLIHPSPSTGRVVRKWSA
jgi:hypothetical protein